MAKRNTITTLELSKLIYVDHSEIVDQLFNMCAYYRGVCGDIGTNDDGSFMMCERSAIALLYIKYDGYDVATLKEYFNS